MNQHVSPNDLTSNIEAEQALLGAILVNNSAYDVVAGTGIMPKHFSEEIHGRIYEACGLMIDSGKSANPVTIKGYLSSDQMIGGETVSQYLARLAVEAVTIVNAPDYARAVMIAWARRDMLGMSEWMKNFAQQAADELEIADELQGLKSRMEQCQRVIEGGEGEGTTFAAAAPLSLQTTMDAVSGKTVTGINYGIPALMQLIGPLLAGKLVIISGMTKHGKSSIAQQIARGCADQGHPAWYYSGEMDASEIIMREKARDTGVSVEQQQKGTVTETELERLHMASSVIGKLPFVVQDRRRTLDQLIRGLKTFVQQAKRIAMPVAIVDSMLLLDRDKSQSRMTDYEFGALVTDRLKAAARDLGIPIVVLGQLKKNTIEKPYRTTRIDASYYRSAIARRPRASDIYGSCEKDADHVVIVYNPEVILQDMEPAEESDEHLAWEDVMNEWRGKAEILLALSRSARWPSRRTVQWDGVRHHFAYASDVQKGLF